MDGTDKAFELLDMSPQKLKELCGASHFSIWLTPNQSEKEYFAKIIGDISSEYISPTFDPHVTIYTGIYELEDDVNETFSELCETHSLISLIIKEVSFSSLFFMSLFVKFFDNSILINMHNHIFNKMRYKAHHKLMPHLSLMYKEMPISMKQDISRKLNIQNTSVEFDSIKVVTPGNPIQGWLDISKWETIFECKLNNFML